MGTPIPERPFVGLVKRRLRHRKFFFTSFALTLVLPFSVTTSAIRTRIRQNLYSLMTTAIACLLHSLPSGRRFHGHQSSHNLFHIYPGHLPDHQCFIGTVGRPEQRCDRGQRRKLAPTPSPHI